TSAQSSIPSAYRELQAGSFNNSCQHRVSCASHRDLTLCQKAYVSHTLADYTAILKLIETRFNLPSLTPRDAAQMDMAEFFDFQSPSLDDASHCSHSKHCWRVLCGPSTLVRPDTNNCPASSPRFGGCFVSC